MVTLIAHPPSPVIASVNLDFFSVTVAEKQEHENVSAHPTLLAT
jgi:hypothetical protein